MSFLKTRHLLAALSLSAALPAQRVSAQDTLARRLPPVVTVTREGGRSLLDLPFAISEAVPDSSRPGQTHTLLDQTLFLLPGVTLANRTNPSQDPRISIRGYGARSAFGVRSIKVLRDGMPLTLPDGQTPVDYLDLESVGRVEVIRGSASALYGNAGGGVIDLRTSPPPEQPFSAQIRSWFGSYDSQRYVGTFGGSAGPAFYQGNIGRTTSDNYRLYSHQRLTNGYFRSGITAAGTDFALQVLGLDMPVAENPGALTIGQLNGDPRLPDSTGVRKRARKAVRQLQVGLSASRQLPARGGELFAQVYGGTRDLFNPQSFAIVDVGRVLGGGSARATLPIEWGVLHRVSIGVDAAEQNDLRRNWANCNAVAAPTATCPTLPAEQGVIQVDQREIVSSLGPYVRDEIQLGERTSLNAGARADVVRFQLQDHYLGDGRDDSGVRTLSAVSPMLGLVSRVGAMAAAYANVGSAFETPTTTELGNQPNGNAGLNPDLKPQFSTTYEAGMKGLALVRFQYDVALFDTEVRDELIPFDIGNGRTAYRNAGRTRRNGVELQAGADLGTLTLNGAYSYSHFRFREYVNAGVEYAGRKIPGIPEHQLQGSATWRRGDLFATLEALGKSAVYVDDANTAKAAGFGVVNLRAGGVGIGGREWLSPEIGVQNLFDRKYVGSVAVNAAGTATTAKFYEPASRRTIVVGLTVGEGR